MAVTYMVYMLTHCLMQIFKQFLIQKFDMFDCQLRMQKNRGRRTKLSKRTHARPPLTSAGVGELLAKFTWPTSVVSHSSQALTHVLLCQEILTV